MRTGMLWHAGLLLSLLSWCACSSTTSGPNRAPVAVAGPDQVGAADEAVVLDGSGSYDADGDELTYRWELVHVPAGGTASLVDADRAQAQLSPDAAGVWLVRLVVSDGKLDSAPDVVQVRFGGCQSDGECDDGVDCTTDTCQAGVCAHGADDGLCDDGFFCNGIETCDAVAGCQPAGAPGCDDGIACTQDGCDEDADSCSHTAIDGDCDDGLYCNGPETCDELQGCLAGQAVDCADGVVCTLDACDEDTDSCGHTASNAACDDGLVCNGTESCDAMNDCQPGVALVCDDGVGCTADSCSEAVGGCQFVPDDGLCDDGSFCNGPEVCDPDNGCQRLAPPACDDGVACTVDSCDDLAGACSFAPNDLLCDDGNTCTVGSCDAQNGCGFVAGNENMACSQGACSGTCSVGVCIPCACTTDADCDDGISCTADSCSNGACSHVADNAACDNDDFCDGAETCVVGQGCQAGAAPDCDDGVACTDDACDEGADTCTNVTNDDNCANGDLCDGVESCDAVQDCQPGVAVNCDDGVACTADACAPLSGQCSHTAVDLDCDNGDFCDGVESCDVDSGCQAGADPCVDAHACTLDACDEDANSCSHTPQDAVCDDGFMCDGSETCDVNGGCQPGSAAANGLPCDEAAGADGDECNSSCQAGACVVAAPNCADDGLMCDGAEICVTGAGCSSAGGVTDGTPCDEGAGSDGDECNSSCQAGACAAVAPSCADDGLLCDGSEVCATGVGCTSGGGVVDGTPCDEGAGQNNDLCDSTCQAGVCAAGGSVVCDDGVFCNGSESCDAAAGCVSTGQQANGTACDEGAGQNGNACDSSCQSGVCQVANATAGQPCDDGVACTDSDDCDGGGGCGGAPSDEICEALMAGMVCRPECFAAASGCGFPPASVAVSCADNPVDLGQGDTSACQIDAGQAGQAACLACSAESGLVVLDATTFDGCDPNGWGLVSGTECYDSYNGCSPGSLNQDCCADLATLCGSLNGDDFLMTDKAVNCGGGVEEWRLEKVFDFSDLTDLSICFDIADHNADNNQVIALWGQDLSDVADPAPVELFCQNNGPRNNVDDTPYRFCVDLSAAAPWVDGNATVRLQFVAHSEANGRIMALDDIVVTGWQNRCPADYVTMVLADFDGCPNALPATWEGWAVSGNIVCNASDFSCYDASTRAIVENGDPAGATLTRRVDASSLEGDVTLCFFNGDDKGDQGRSLTVEFDTGSGYQTAWSLTGNQGPDKTCAEICVNLSLLDPAATRNPDLGLRFTMMSTKDPLHVDHITLTGANNCPVSDEVVLGAIADLGGGAYSFSAQDAVAEQLDADIQCTWGGLADGREVVGFRNQVQNFGARRKLVFDNAGQGESLSNFPVLVVLDDAWFDYGLTKADGSDLMFIDADLVNVLPYEIERWNPSGESTIWVKVPHIPGGANDDYIWMYYDDPEADIAQDPAAVWSDYTAVWHLNENTTDEQNSGQHADATGHGNTGAQGGNAAVGGRIAGGQNFDGVDDLITVSNAGLQIAGQALTIEAWARHVWDGNFSNTFRHVASAGSDGHIWQLWFDRGWDGWHGRLEASGGNTDIFTNSGTSAVWSYLALRYDGAAVRLYLNATQIGSDNTSGNLVPIDSDFWIGDNPGIAGERQFSGDIDEVRIRASVLSADWLAAQYLSMTDAFISFGPEEPL